MAQDQDCLLGWCSAPGQWPEALGEAEWSAVGSFLKGPGSVIEGLGLCFGSPGPMSFPRNDPSAHMDQVRL